MRTGVYLCQTGTGDLDAAGLHSLVSYAGNLPNVEMVRDLGTMPALNIEALAAEIQANDLQRVIVAGDSPASSSRRSRPR